MNDPETTVFTVSCDEDGMYISAIHRAADLYQPMTGDDLTQFQKEFALSDRDVAEIARVTVDLVRCWRSGELSMAMVKAHELRWGVWCGRAVQIAENDGVCCADCRAFAVRHMRGLPALQ